MRHPGKIDVVDVTAASGQKFRVFNAGQGLSELGNGHRELTHMEGNGCLNIMRFVDLAKSVKYQLYVRFDQARVITP